MPKPRKPRPARVRMASDEFSVRITGNVRVEFLNRCLVMMRQVEAPTTRADSTYADSLMRITSARIVRKYCGMYTTVMEMPEARMPLHRPDWPWEIMMAIRMASSSEGKE